MAAPPPFVDDLHALIQIPILQAQVAAHQAATHAAPAAGPAAVVAFADMPQMLNANKLLHYLTKRGSSIYEQGCKANDNKALTNGFGMTTNQTVVFAQAYSCCAIVMGWNKGTKQITTFANCTETPVDLIKCYGQINKATKVGEVDTQSYARQNSMMMAICLASSLMAKAQARLLTYHNKYTFNGVEYAPLM
jgi:hypothetical protein